jgi:hypothetical protein
MTAPAGASLLVKQGVTAALGIALLTPVPEGLTRGAWHLFATAAAIAP